MLQSTEQIIDSGLGKHIIRSVDLANLFGGSPARRYGLINKALNKGELVQLRRGLYMLAPKYLSQRYSQYYIANHLVSHSFVSAESALSFHGWIPERIDTVTSIAAFGRNRECNTPYGKFVYSTPPIDSHQFFTRVQQLQINEQPVWMATPLRALIDYIYWHKVDNAGLDFLKNSLRIEVDNLSTVKKKDIYELQLVYYAKPVTQFLRNLLKELPYD